MKTMLLLGYIFLNTVSAAEPKTVYICNNKKTKKYHYSASCKGLSNCQYKVTKLTESAAKRKGLALCAWEARKSKH